jgi:hypothetical protein
MKKTNATLANEAVIELEKATSQPNFLAALKAINLTVQELAKNSASVTKVDASASDATLADVAVDAKAGGKAESTSLPKVTDKLNTTDTREQLMGKDITTETVLSEHYKVHKAEINAPSVPFVPYATEA